MLELKESQVARPQRARAPEECLAVNLERQEGPDEARAKKEGLKRIYTLKAVRRY